MTEGEATSTRSWQFKLKRLITNLFLVTILIIFTLDAWPSDLVGGDIITDLQARIDPLLDVTGLWQTPWYVLTVQQQR